MRHQELATFVAKGRRTLKVVAGFPNRKFGDVQSAGSVNVSRGLSHVEVPERS